MGAFPDRASIALGHRRLSIIDLSDAASQPMAYDNGTLWLVFNGEIYNYLELRQELAGNGYRFATNSDTEVILAAYAHWGPACVERFNGMFAFALWDDARQRLFCARDHLGTSPSSSFATTTALPLHPIRRLERVPRQPALQVWGGCLPCKFVLPGAGEHLRGRRQAVARALDDDRTVRRDGDSPLLATARRRARCRNSLNLYRSWKRSCWRQSPAVAQRRSVGALLSGGVTAVWSSPLRPNCR